MSSIREKYYNQVIPEMKKSFGLKNGFEVPKIEKVVINTGVGKFIKDSNSVTDIYNSLTEIAGQKPVMTKSRKSIAGFKTREGLEIGIKVTLRGKRMWDFIDRLIAAAVPRIRDFHGIKESSVDRNGNFSLGIKDHLIFPEIMPEKVKTIFGLQVNIATNAKDHKKGLELFRMMGFPLMNEEKEKSKK